MSRPYYRSLTDHKVGPLDQALEIAVLDEPGAGGGHHDYVVGIIKEHAEFRSSSLHELARIKFQNGPMKESGVNGVSIEALIAINIDRLRCFQAGPYACEANGNALAHLESALECLQARTRERLARNVEGTSTI